MKRSLWGLAPVLGSLFLWEALVRAGLTSGPFLPPPSQVGEVLWNLLKSGELPEAFFRSSVRVLVGFAAGSVAGLALGILMGIKDLLRRTLGPLLALLYPIPALGWLPLLMLWIGVNELLPMAVVFICSFFPVLYNTMTGIRQVDRELIAAARVLGASPWRILREVVLPQAVPTIFTGLRLEAGMAWRVIIAAEMVAIPTGIGALMMKAESLMRVDIIIVCLGVLAAVCFLFERAFSWMEGRLTRWK